MKSIVQSDNRCFLCGRNGNGDPLETHHIFFGPNRKLSDQDGMTVLLCGERCHRNGKNSVHMNATVDKKLKEIGQAVWEAHYGPTKEFIKRYGRNYL